MNNCFMADTLFSNVIFSNVDLTDSRFKRSKFDNVKFIKCILDKPTFEDVCGIESVEFINNSYFPH